MRCISLLQYLATTESFAVSSLLPVLSEYERIMSTPTSTFESSLDLVKTFLVDRNRALPELPTRPTRSALDTALKALPSSLPEEGWGTKQTIEHLLRNVVPGLWTGHAGNRYFGLVTGGVTKGAQLGDIIATSCSYREFSLRLAIIG